MKDSVHITDRLQLSSGAMGVQGRPKEPVTIEGFFSCFCRERGKIVPFSRREGKNIWTLTGREYLAQLMSYAAYGSPGTPQRNDRIKYIGFGTGAQEEVSSVSQLAAPTPVDNTGAYLGILDVPPTYPLTPIRTTVQYKRTFSEFEISVLGTVILTEAGLFTDGSPDAGWEPGTRDVFSGAYPMAF
jgi:hypothetical protein